MPSLPFHLTLAPDAVGTLSLASSPIAPGAAAGRWMVRLTAGGAGFSGGCSLEAPLVGGTPWFLFPGFFYGQGRQAGEAVTYPGLGTGEDWLATSWDFALDRGAFPTLLATQDGMWRGFDWTPHFTVSGAEDGPDTWGDTEPQIGCGLTWDAGCGALRVNLPATERPLRHSCCQYDGPTARRLVLPPGASVSFELGWWETPGDAHGYAPILAQVYAALHASHPAAVPEADALLARTAAHGLLAWHWVEEPGYLVYTAPFNRVGEFNANQRGVTLGWHFMGTGFVGGLPVAYGLLWHAQRVGDVAAARVAERLLTHICAGAPTPMGLLRTSWHPGRARTPNGAFPNPAPIGVANHDPTGETPFWGSCWLPDQRLVRSIEK
jgi:hypothetical protein